MPRKRARDSRLKTWVSALLFWPILSSGEALVPAENPRVNDLGPPISQAQQQSPEDEPVTWVDSSHAYATDQVQALTVWMDNFFGDPTYDREQPESLVRVDWSNTWDQEDGYKTRARLRGKLHLPKISKRLNLLFNGEDGDELGADERRDNTDLVGIQYSLGELNRSRVDLTLDAGTWELRPGVRYRNQGPISEQVGYRYTQQLEYRDDEGFLTTGEVNLDRVIDENTLLRWSNQLSYGEETDGQEWLTQLSLDQRLRPLHKKHQFVIGYFGSVEGVTDPDYIRNYRVGVLFRRQVFRPFLFAELEPSYNLRRDSADESRSDAWIVMLRFEVVLQPGLARGWNK